MHKTFSMDTISPHQYFNLGDHRRLITTSSEAAQYWFNHGLNWCYGFNQEEGLVCFKKALEHDSDCAMAYWGIAYASGPFYNLPWCDFGEKELAECPRLCFYHTQKALSFKERLCAPEITLIEALSKRFQSPDPVSQTEFNRWDDEYSNAMRAAYQEFPEDTDIAALFVEAMMTRTPWKLWDVRSGEPGENAHTLECLEVLEKAIRQSKHSYQTQHPAILHFHIHVLEMSNTPERALESADILCDLCPEAGHMNHMPSHIYALCGLYDKAKVASEKAIVADRLYRNYAGDENFYTTARCHDLHMMMSSCMFLGLYEPALEASEEMCASLTPELIGIPNRPQMTDTLEGYYSNKIHVLVRFGRWQEIVDEAMPEPANLYLASVPMWHYARGIAFSAMGQFEEADQEKELFEAARKLVPPERKIFNNPVTGILGVAEEMMKGEIEYHRGNHQAGYAHLRKSVKLDDNLAYSEPWPWMHPPRHALGALLLEQGHKEEAELVYRTDLGLNDALYRCAQHPGNIWSLHGLEEILRDREQDEEYDSIKQQLNLAMEKSDHTVSSSCCCRKSVAVKTSNPGKKPPR